MRCYAVPCGAMRCGKGRAGFAHGKGGAVIGALAGAIDAKYREAGPPPDGWDEAHPAVARVLGTGPWAWAGITPLAFLGNGMLHTPWGRGT